MLNFYFFTRFVFAYRVRSSLFFAFVDIDDGVPRRVSEEGRGWGRGMWWGGGGVPWHTRLEENNQNTSNYERYNYLIIVFVLLLGVFFLFVLWPRVGVEGGRGSVPELA